MRTPKPPPSQIALADYARRSTRTRKPKPRPRARLSPRARNLAPNRVPPASRLGYACTPPRLVIEVEVASRVGPIHTEAPPRPPWTSVRLLKQGWWTVNGTGKYVQARHGADVVVIAAVVGLERVVAEPRIPGANAVARLARAPALRSNIPPIRQAGRGKCGEGDPGAAAHRAACSLGREER